jgi:hypothetical protein
LELRSAISDGMANNRAAIPDNPDDRRDVVHEGSSLSGSTKRNNDATEKALHPEASADAGRSPEKETVDQDPGQTQKQNQGGRKGRPTGGMNHRAPATAGVFSANEGLVLTVYRSDDMLVERRRIETL